ncbi:hypothetical protein AGRA3207_006361 [Actinomadura graeca]|uniref:Uncharacterized protein n=1 Tax=Actinomadura graeca TaxID=2750812 RepID=A0ABX8R5E1_9ACTN|nr:hypothetical protein [Actinomadura graeca]QXJ24942.1 hypothetical protein AGRA3207_006361 [Actinomadura graeca]
MRFDEKYAEDTLTARRTSYSTDLRRSADPDVRKYRVDSLRTLERRENDGIDKVSRFLAEEDAQAVGTGPRLTAAHAHTGEPLTLVTEAISSTCQFSATGAIVQNDVRVWLKALVPQASPQVTVDYRYYSESRPGVLDIEPIFGCDVVRRSENSAGGVLATLELPKRLGSDDGIYVFAYRVRVNSEARAEPVLSWSPLTGHTRRIEFQLLFDPRMTPSRVWWFRAASDTTGELEPDTADMQHLERLDRGSYVYKIFDGRPLEPLLNYGVAWSWDP